jgi:thiamine biosynthesis lipoprotein
MNSCLNLFRTEAPSLRTVFSALVLILAFSTFSLNAGWLKQQQDIMGTRVSVEVWHKDASLTQQCSQKIFNEMHRIDALMSSYKSNSELSFINDNAAISAVDISQEMVNIINRSLHFSELSHGAFDITFASVGYRYDYRNRAAPSEQVIEQGLASIDYRHIKLNQNKLYFDDAGVRIDLGGIAKGYAVDQAIEIARQCGIKEAMVSAGGDSKILGNKRGRPWVIGIQHPRKKTKLALRLPLSDTAISTSGDYERFFIRNGQRIHHIINPATGKSAMTAWSATVTGPDGMTTDALSTTIFILGAKKGIELIETLEDMDAIIIDNKGMVHYSSGFQEPE